jgi:hypothetical protein
MSLSKKTQYIGTEINWGNSLTQGLIFCHNADVGNNDLVRRMPGSSSTTSKLIFPVSNYGYTNSNPTFTANQTTHMDITSGGMSVFCSGYVKSLVASSGFVERVTYVNESNNQGWTLGTSSTATTLRMGFFRNIGTGGGSLSLVEAANTVAVGKMNFLGTTNGTNLKRLYSNGRLVASSATGNFIGLSAPGATLTVSPSGTASATNLSMVWNRELTAAEAAALYENPHQIFRSRTKYFMRTGYATTSYSATVAVNLASDSSSLTSSHTSAPTASSSTTLSSATSGVKAFYYRSDEFVVNDYTYDVSAGSTFPQMPNTTTLVGFIGAPEFVPNTGTMGFGFSDVGPYVTNKYILSPFDLDKKEIVYIKTDIKPITTGGTYSF